MANTYTHIVDGITNDDNSTSHLRADMRFSQILVKTEKVKRKLNPLEQLILDAINSSLRNWYKPWRTTYLADGREFKIVYDLMEGLLHYEYQVTNSESALSDERARAVAKAVARLIDYGNAILGLDITTRSESDPLKELDPNRCTTIELYHAYLKAQALRDKLLYDYFRKDKPHQPNSLSEDTLSTDQQATSSSLQVPSQPSSLTSTLERGQKYIGGSTTSVNTVRDGMRTPNPVSQPSLSIVPTDQEARWHPDIAPLMSLLKSSAFTAPSNSNHRAIALLPSVLAKIQSLLSVPTSTEKIINCFELLDALLIAIEKIPPDNRTQEIMLISTSLLKPLVKKVYIDDRDSTIEYQHTHWTVCLLSIIRLMNASDFNTYLKHFSTAADLAAFLKDYLFIVKRLISAEKQSTKNLHQDLDSISDSPPVFPPCWIEMTLLSSATFLTSLTYLYQVLVQLFPSNLPLWTSFIDCLIHFILQETLQPERDKLKERQRLLADDLRQRSADYVWISWDVLNIDQKQQLLEDLIEPLLRAAISLNSRQRSILLPIFYDMMRCDYTSQYVTPRASMRGSTSTNLHSPIDSNSFIYQDDLESLPPTNQMDYISHSKLDQALPYLAYRDLSVDGTVLTKFTHLVVCKLNNLMIDQDLGDETFKNEICRAISGELDPKYYDRSNANVGSGLGDTTRFRSMARQTSDLISEFMQICLDARQANKLMYKHLYMLCLFKLVLFFKDKVDNPELYLNNLYKLCHLHHLAGRFAEAGFTLIEHAKTLPWSDKPLENHLRMANRFFQTPTLLQDYNGLKIFLYDTIITYFDHSQLWEPAIPLCRELIDFYEFKTYEYKKLADTLQRMSFFYKNMVEPGIRSNPEYFRVSFYGSGFPVSLRNVTIVYRGKPYEKLGDFQATMLTKYPDAQLLNSLSKPDESKLELPEARYLQINACQPIVDLKCKFGLDIAKIEERVLDYYRHNECDKFQFTRRIANPCNGNVCSSSSSMRQVSEDNFANMWRERTTLTTNSLPGILPFFPVYLIETSIVSPIENAIEDLERTNDRLSCMVNRFKADKRQEEDVRLLGQLLLGIVDAAVNGGIAKYEEAFFEVANNDISTITAPSSLSPTTTTTAVTTRLISSGFESSTPGGQFVAKEMLKQSKDNYTTQPTNVNFGRPSNDQVDRLKRLIAQQVPLLDEAIRLHRDRVADVMRPQHEHLESSYKKLKHNVMTKYAKHLPPDYSKSTMRSYRSLARSPNRSMRSESRLPLSSSTSAVSGDAAKSNWTLKHNLDSTNSGRQINLPLEQSGYKATTLSNIPYKQLDNEQRPIAIINSSSENKWSISGEPAVEQRNLHKTGSAQSSSYPISALIKPHREAPLPPEKPIPTLRTSLVENDSSQRILNKHSGGVESEFYTRAPLVRDTKAIEQNTLDEPLDVQPASLHIKRSGIASDIKATSASDSMRTSNAKDEEDSDLVSFL